jgi:hypothetical protein
MSKEYTWFDIEKLPSGGLSYPENWKISIRPYSFGDVLSLARAAETGIGALDKILSGIKCSFDKELLLPADILYLGIYRKLVSTKHSKIEFTVECPVCAKENKKVMELTELKFKEIEIPKLPIRAKLEAGTLEFMPITLGKYREVLKKFNGAPDWLLAFSVQNMDPGEARDIIMNAVDIDKEVLDEVADLLNFGLLPIEFECQDEFCDNIITVNLESPETVVMPFRESGESYQDRIEFGNEPRSKRSGDSGD